MNFQSEEDYNAYMGAAAAAEAEAAADAAYAQHVEQSSLQPTAILSLFQTTKAERMTFISNVMDEIEGGKIEPLKILVWLKSIESIMTQMTSLDEKKNKEGIEIAKRFRNHLQTAAEKYGQKKFNYLNASLEIKETGTKYDYTKCEDSVLNALLIEQERIDSEVKKRQEMLKTVSVKGMTLVDEGTGETFTIYPPAKSSTTSIAVSLK